MKESKSSVKATLSTISVPFHLGFVYAAFNPLSEKEVCFKIFCSLSILYFKAFTFTVFDKRPDFLLLHGYSMHVLDLKVVTSMINILYTNEVSASALSM